MPKTVASPYRKVCLGAPGICLINVPGLKGFEALLFSDTEAQCLGEPRHMPGQHCN